MFHLTDDRQSNTPDSLSMQFLYSIRTNHISMALLTTSYLVLTMISCSTILLFPSISHSTSYRYFAIQIQRQKQLCYQYRNGCIHLLWNGCGILLLDEVGMFSCSCLLSSMLEECIWGISILLFLASLSLL